MKRSSTWIALIAALILGAGATELARAGYSVDEEFTIFAVRGIRSHGLPLLPSGLVYDRGIAYSYASWGLGLISGSELPAYRFVSLLSAASSIALVFAILRQLASSHAGLLASLLVASSLPFWATATSARFYAPFLASYLAVLLAMNSRALLAVMLLAMVARWLHELAFTLALVPLVVMLIDRTDRRRWMGVAVAVVGGLLIAQAGLLAIHYAAPSSGETMVRRFFVWQVVNLFERPPERQFGIALLVMAIGWIVAPRRAGVLSVVALCIAAGIIAFSVARATTVAPFTFELVRSVLVDGSRYPLDMFWHVAAATPIVMTLAIACLLARLFGVGGHWPPEHRAIHLAWLGWVIWFGVIESGITINYLLIPMSFMLIAIAVDVTAIVAAVANGRLSLTAPVAAVLIVALAFDQWHGHGSPRARLEMLRPTINIDGIDEIRESIQPNDLIACTDELACMLLVGRVDAWLALDDYVRERFLVQREAGRSVGVYAGVPAVSRPGDLFTVRPDGALPDRVLVIDVFKEFPIGNSREWLPRAIELDGLQVQPLLETPQARVLQISPPQRNALGESQKNRGITGG